MELAKEMKVMLLYPRKAVLHDSGKNETHNFLFLLEIRILSRFSQKKYLLALLPKVHNKTNKPILVSWTDRLIYEVPYFH